MTPLVAPRWDAARAALASLVCSLPSQPVELSAANGLVLATDLVAKLALPNFDTSAMDGWAVCGTGPWRVIGRALAGRPIEISLAPGEAVEIATGGVVPHGADAVLRSEAGALSNRAGALVLSAEQPNLGMHVRPRAEECAKDEILAPAGAEIGPALIGLAAAVGYDELLVIPSPKVALILMGDELATLGMPGPGQVRDSLGPQIPVWVQLLGGEVVQTIRSADTVTAHVEAIAAAAGSVDLILTTGGTASGPVDHLHEAIRDLGGTLVIDSVAVRPGHPMLAATLPTNARWLVGLPGNPQSAIVTLMSLAAPLLAGLAGRWPLPELATILAGDFVPAPPQEDRLVLGTRSVETFHVGTHLGSGMLRGLAAATGFGVLPPGGVGKGQPVRWLPLP